MKRAGWILAILFALLVLLASAAAFVAGTATGFRWLAGTATTLSGERLKLEGVDGHLGVPLGIQTLTITTATQRIETASKPASAAMPGELLKNTVGIEHGQPPSMRLQRPVPPMVPAG